MVKFCMCFVPLQMNKFFSSVKSSACSPNLSSHLLTGHLAQGHSWLSGSDICMLCSYTGSSIVSRFDDPWEIGPPPRQGLPTPPWDRSTRGGPPAAGWWHIAVVRMMISPISMSLTNHLSTQASLFLYAILTYSFAHALLRNNEV